MSLQKQFIQYVKKNQFWEPKSNVCIAVSGGIDSMVLMHLMHRTQRFHQAQLEVCTIDHQLRRESLKECSLVVEEANKIGLRTHHHKICIERGGNLYERARTARQRVLLSLGCDRIATGHHQQDQAETVLYRLLRGSGIQGLSGMRPLSIPWCRPLLFASKQQIQDFAKKEGLRWLDDPSNSKSLRGSLREIFPILDAIHGPSVPAIARTAQSLANDAELLEAYTQEAWKRSHIEGHLCRKIWEKERKGMQFRLLKELFVFHGIPIRYNIIASFVAYPSKIQLPKGGWIELDEEKIWIVPKE